MTSLIASAYWYMYNMLPACTLLYVLFNVLRSVAIMHVSNNFSVTIKIVNHACRQVHDYIFYPY